MLCDDKLTCNHYNKKPLFSVLWEYIFKRNADIIVFATFAEVKFQIV